MPFYQYNHVRYDASAVADRQLFAFGIIFAALGAHCNARLADEVDAYNIGANDVGRSAASFSSQALNPQVANSFATSVSSRSLTMPQACLAAAICELCAENAPRAA